MEKLCFQNCRLSSRAGSLLALGLSAAIALPALAPYASAQDSVVQQEINRRRANSREAQTLLLKGDAAYKKQDYKAAVAHFSRAYSLLPIGASQHELRRATAQRYATAATERSRQLAKGGNYDAAKKLLDTVLGSSVAPAHLGALKLRKQVDDPIRYNPALTPAHVSKAQKVGLTLREADGFYSLGQYDRALMVYQDALRLDPFNKAARRGMEKVNTVQSDYYRAAADHTRAKMLSEVDATWELPVPPAEGLPPNAPGLDGGLIDFAPSLNDKLAGIIVETVILDRATLEEAIDFVRHHSREGDAPDAAGEKAGVNVIINLGDDDSETAKKISARRISIKATKLPLSTILDYIADQSGTKWRADGVGIIVTPRNSTDSAMLSRTFKVPHNFLTSSIAGVGNKAEDNNPFGANGDKPEGKIVTPMSAKEFLQKSGVSFPDGAIAQLTAGSLYIRNTAANIDIVDQLVTSIKNEEPVQVIVRTTIMRVSEEDLKELSFDWAISPVGLGGGLNLGGGTNGNTSGIGAIPALPFTSSNANSITAGNRSGNSALQPNAIDSFLNSSQTGVASNSSRRAPGILTLHGVYSNFHIQMMMRGLAQKTSTDVMVRPSAVTRSGQRAKIEVIRQFTYPTEYEPPELPNSVGGGGLFDPTTGEEASASPATPVTPAHPTAFEDRPVGVILEVEPRVSSDKHYIDLSISPEMVEFEGFVNYGSPINGVSAGSLTANLGNLGGGNVFSTTPGTFGRVTDNRILMPIFKTIRMRNHTLTIQDGHTIVMGGVITSRKTKVEDKTPILGDIPLIGRTFRSNASRTYNEVVLIMVNAEIIDPAGQPWRKR